MTALSKEKARRITTHVAFGLPLPATTRIYMGAAVSINSSGYARGLNVSDSLFAGFAVETADNNRSGANNAAGDVVATLAGVGEVEIPVTGVTGIGDVGDDVYATDEDTFQLNSTSAIKIGKITRYVSGTTVRVWFEAHPFRSI